MHQQNLRRPYPGDLEFVTCSTRVTTPGRALFVFANVKPLQNAFWFEIRLSCSGFSFLHLNPHVLDFTHCFFDTIIFFDFRD